MTTSDNTLRLRVLLAEDDQSVRQVITRIIERLGFEVLAVTDGASAVAAVEAKQESFVCVLLDMGLPGMNGVAAAQAIQKIAPELPLLLMSGCVRAEYGAAIAQLRLIGILHKPFSSATLRSQLQAAYPALSSM